MKPCRECSHLISENAAMCPQCGAPYPAKEKWDGYGFEYKSKATLGRLPILHLSFKYRPNKVPVIARGVVAIGQFAIGFISIAQFGIGIVSISQFALGVWVIGQFCLAWSFIGQLGLYIHRAMGMAIYSLPELIEKLLTYL